MKLATRRIQKAEAKSKSERKGRSGDKSVAHKAERRHHSTDKVHDRSEHRSLSSDRISNNQSEQLDDTLEHKAQRSEKHARRIVVRSQNVEENDPSKKVPHATKGKDTGDSKTHRSKKQLEGTSNHGEYLENGQISSDRLGRSNEKYLPKKLEHRTQSLDRFLRDKHKNLSSSTGKTGVEVHSTEGSQYSTQKGLLCATNSIEHTYSPATNLVTSPSRSPRGSFLQDLDSGEYFLVDMACTGQNKNVLWPGNKKLCATSSTIPEAVCDKLHHWRLWTHHH